MAIGRCLACPVRPRLAPMMGYQHLAALVMMILGSSNSLVVHVAKCCNTDHIFNETSSECQEGLFNKSALVIYESDHGNETIMSNDQVVFITGALEQDDCQSHSRKILQPQMYPGDQYRLLQNGSLFLPMLNIHLGHKNDHRDYCLEQCIPSGMVVVIVCSQEGMSGHDVPDCRRREIIYSVAMCVSVACLASTLLVYMALPELRNAPGKKLVCLASSLLVAYVLLVAIRLFGGSQAWPKWVCISAAVALLNSFLSAFSWMTVISFDICFTFGTTKQVSSANFRARKRNTNWHYLAVGWGLPLITTLVALGIDLSPLTSFDLIKPNFGLSSCWFHGKWEILAYFYGPIGCLLLANLFFFAWTSYSLCTLQSHLKQEQGKQLWRRHSASDNCQQNVNQARQKMWLYLKIYIVMGLSWVFEILSWALPSATTCWPWYFITDLINALEGLWIFLIYVAKPQVYRKVLNKITGAQPMHMVQWPGMTTPPISSPGLTRLSVMSSSSVPARQQPPSSSLAESCLKI